MRPFASDFSIKAEPMAVVLSFPKRFETDPRPSAAVPASAEIVILPCVRRERIVSPLGFAERCDEKRPTQRKA